MGRFLEWGALNSQVMVGGVLVFWDNRVLKLTGMEIRDFSISNRFKNIENGFCWVFMGWYGHYYWEAHRSFLEGVGDYRGFVSGSLVLRRRF